MSDRSRAHALIAWGLVLTLAVGTGTTTRAADEDLAALRRQAQADPTAPETRAAAFTLAEALARRAGSWDRDAREAGLVATLLYPDDPRSRRMLLDIAEAALDAGDPFEAHVALVRGLDFETVRARPELAVRAATAAVEIGDVAAAVTWTDAIDPYALPERLLPGFLRARLLATHAVGRVEAAMAAVDVLEAGFPEALRADADSLYAAAETLAEVGHRERARVAYDRFVNVHPRAERRPVALGAWSTIESDLGRTDRAGQLLDLLVSEYPEHPEAQLARVARLDLVPGELDDDLGHRYLDAARDSIDAAGASAAMRRIVERGLADGVPVRVAALLAAAVRNDDGSLAALAARDALGRALPVLLAQARSRGTDVDVVSVALDAERADVPLSEEVLADVAGARRALGLSNTADDLERAVREARAARRSGEREDVVPVLEEALLIAWRPDPTVESEARMLLAEAYWMSDRAEDARRELDRARDLLPEGADDRRLTVLDADLRFAAGDVEGACEGYRAATAVRASRWVDAQLLRCAGSGPKDEPAVNVAEREADDEDEVADTDATTDAVEPAAVSATPGIEPETAP